MTDATRYTVPKEPGRWRAITLAALVHAALLAFFWIGIRWQSETPVTIEAEVWSPEVREAAPVPEPQREPEPQPEPQPVVKEAPPPKPQPVEQPAPKPDVKPMDNPDIALEQKKKRKEEEEKKRLEEERLAKQKEQKRLEEERLAKQKEQKRLEEERLAKLKEEKRQEEERLAKLKEKKRLEEERLAELKLKQQQAEEQKRLEREKAEKAEKAAQAKKAAEEKKRKQEEAEAQMLAKAREQEMRRLTGGVAGTGGNGDAPKSQGGGRADAGYAAKVAAKIKSNINFNAPEGAEGNPAAEFEVVLLPDGSVSGIRRIKSSGIPGFDDAVKRAIEKSQPYPKDSSGSVPSRFTGIHKLKD